MPPLRIDGKFRLFKFKNYGGDIYSLSIRCDKENEPFFRKLCDAVARESCRCTGEYRKHGFMKVGEIQSAISEKSAFSTWPMF